MKHPHALLLEKLYADFSQGNLAAVLAACDDSITFQEIRTAHVWRFENSKPVAWYEYPRDLYQYDAIWS